MISYTSNPIVVRKNGKIIDLIELEIDCDIKPFKLEIYSNDKLKFKGNINLSSLITLKDDTGDFKFVYKDVKTNEVILEKTIHVGKNNLEIEIESDDLTTKLENIVKSVMDSPQGTEEEVSMHTEMLKKALIDKNARIYVTSKIRQIIVQSNLVKGKAIEEQVYKIYSNLYGMGIIQELDDDLEIGEIMVNATTFPTFKSSIYYIKNGVKYKYNKGFTNLSELKQVFSRSVEFNNKELNAIDNSIVEATRENKDRVNIIIPTASDNYILNIRKFSNFIPDETNMKLSGTVDDYMDRLFRVLVQGKANIGVGGAMGTGKTTIINFLLTYTDPMERKVVIASVNETDIDRVLKGHDICVFNVDEEKKFTFEKLMRASLRTTASRVVIPESRGSEFRQIYEANLKTKGNMFTAHAHDDYSFLEVCCDMYAGDNAVSGDGAIFLKNKISKSLDIIIIMRKVGDKIRVKSISEVVTKDNKFEKMNCLYKWVFDPEKPLEGKYERTDKRLSNEIKSRLNENGVPLSLMKDL